MDAKNIPPLGLSFDDVLLIPDYADFKRQDINLSTQLTKKITLKIPLVSSPMDTVTEANLAIALAEIGGIGILHRNLAIDDQADQVKKVSDKKLLVGAAVGASKGFEDRVAALIKAGVSVLLVDSAHGFATGIIEAIRFIKKTYPQMEVVGGNVATEAGAQAMIAAGADGIRVGMGGGAICTTRIISGMGVPQLTAILEAAKAGKRHGVPVIADGAIKYSGDMVKALAAGASNVMMGGYFASTRESAGEVVELPREQVPHRFKSILRPDVEMYQFKTYRGMGSQGAMEQGAKIKSEDEYHGKSYKDRVLVAEGVEGYVPVKGSVSDLVDQAIGGIKSGMYYLGTKTITELWEKAKFMQITQASLTESHPHDILITNAGENY
ncbi:MAG: IMP dehydrogenase [Patescibacteria group bacterium]